MKFFMKPISDLPRICRFMDRSQFLTANFLVFLALHAHCAMGETKKLLPPGVHFEHSIYFPQLLSFLFILIFEFGALDLSSSTL